jgi:hypothetical protein
MTERHDIWHVADGLQMDLRAAQAKLVELRARLAQLDLPEPSAVTCPRCGLKCRGPNTLAEHLHVIHDGPLPDHWSAADALVASHTRAQASDLEEPSLDV